MSQAHEQLFDYAPFLLKVDKLAAELHEACLHKNYDGIKPMCNELVVQARMLKAWANDMEEKSAA
jgi:hypothetical protein